MCPTRLEHTMCLAVQQQFDRLVRKRAFQPIARFITSSDAEDRLSEGIAQTFEIAQRKAAKGEQMADALVVYAARLRATDIRRQFVKEASPGATPSTRQTTPTAGPRSSTSTG